MMYNLRVLRWRRRKLRALIIQFAWIVFLFNVFKIFGEVFKPTNGVDTKHVVHQLSTLPSAFQLLDNPNNTENRVIMDNLYTSKNYASRTTPVRLKLSKSVPAHLTNFDKTRPDYYGKIGQGIAYIDEIVSSEKIVNPYPYKFIINPEHFCANQTLLFIVYVHSAPENFERRRFIRRTWGNSSYHAQHVRYKVLFVMGEPYIDIQKSIDQESEHFGDILQATFHDSYRNLTIKAMTALKWIDQHCSSVRFVLKSDDDTFINMFTYIAYLQNVIKFHKQFESNTILCAVWHQMTVLRKGKWKVTDEEYRAHYYPDYCSGCAFTFTIDVARAIHRVSHYVRAFWVDDVYISGILPNRIGSVKYKNLGFMYEMNSRKIQHSFMGPLAWRFAFVSDNRNITVMERVWCQILDKNRRLKHM